MKDKNRMPFKELLARTQAFVKKKGITQQDLDEAIKRAKKKEPSLKELLASTRKAVEEAEITPKDVEEAIRHVRREKS